MSWAKLRLRQLDYTFIKSLSLVETRFNFNWVSAQFNLVWFRFRFKFRFRLPSII